MIYNITYYDKDIMKEINELVGFSFTFIEKIKRKGVGSPRFKLVNFSDEFIPFLNTTLDIKYVSIELRAKGIIVYLSLNTRFFAWVIPYYHLNYYQTSGQFILYGNKGKLNLLIENNLQYKFLSKITQMKSAYQLKTIQHEGFINQ